MTAVRGRWKLIVVAAVVLAVAAVVVSLAAWNSSSDASTATTTETEQAMLDFAQCMRDNGVPSFPDPMALPDGTFGFERPEDASPSALDDALERCQAEARAIGIDSGTDGSDAEAQDALLRLSRCMRENGIPEFPDPKPGSDALSGLHDLFRGYDLESPRVATALTACQPALNQLLGGLHGGGG